MLRFIPKKDDVKTHAESNFHSRDKADYFASLCAKNLYVFNIEKIKDGFGVRVEFNEDYIVEFSKGIQSEIGKLYTQSIK